MPDTHKSMDGPERLFSARDLVAQHVAAVYRHSMSSYDERALDDISRRAENMLLTAAAQDASTRSSAPTPLLRATSGGTASARWSSLGQMPGHEITSTGVRFLGVTRQDNHCVFLLHVDTGSEQFVLPKRFSQFRELRQSLLQSLATRNRTTTDKDAQRRCRGGACTQLLAQIKAVKFPHRKLRLHQKPDVHAAKDRIAQLQRFVEALLRTYRMAPKRQVRCCLNSQCPVLSAIRGFLDIAENGSDTDDADWKPRAFTDADAMPMLDTPPALASPPQQSRPALPPSPCHSASSAEGTQRRSQRDFPPPTRASLQTDADAQFEQLYTITEDSELLHLHA